MDEERQERIRYYAFAAFVGALLVANWLGIFKTIFGVDTAILITLLAGYKTFYNSISALMERRISADIALCIAVIAALSVGQYLAAAEAMFIVLVGEGLNSSGDPSLRGTDAAARPLASQRTGARGGGCVPGRGRSYPGPGWRKASGRWGNRLRLFGDQ
jgi:cation transport ATPase